VAKYNEIPTTNAGIASGGQRAEPQAAMRRPPERPSRLTLPLPGGGTVAGACFGNIRERKSHLE
jgi:hypothetical protein